MSNQCNCADLPWVFGLFDVESAFGHLELVAEKNDGMQTLYRCKVCSRSWQLDDQDTEIRLAMRILHPDEWITYDDKSIRMAFLVNTRGGQSEENCTWSDCKLKSLSGMLYCAFHATEI